MSTNYQTPLKKGKQCIVSGRPQVDFLARKLIVKNAEHWIVGHADIDGGRIAISAEDLDPRSTRLLDWGTVAAGGEVAFSVEYRGPDISEQFEACLFGLSSFGSRSSDLKESAADRDPRCLATSVVRVLAEHNLNDGHRVGHHQLLEAPPRRSTFWPDRLIIQDSDDWEIVDVLVAGRSLSFQCVPGAMLASGIPFAGKVGPDDSFVVAAKYVGSLDRVPLLKYELSGSAMRPVEDPMYCLSLSSGCRILPNTSAQITSRPLFLLPGKGFRARHVVVSRGRNWVVNDFRVGMCTQFAQYGQISGVAFSPENAGNHVSFSVLEHGRDFVALVTNDGAVPAPFVCGVLGEIVDL